MQIWKRIFAVEPDPTTPQDYLAAADADLKAAETEFAEAHFAVNQFYVRHREFLPVNQVAGKVTVTIRPPSMELSTLLSRENCAIAARNKAMQRRAELRERFLPEQKHIAGVRVP